jgi:hypothetical protein
MWTIGVADRARSGNTLKSGSGCLTIGVYFSYGPAGVLLIVDELFRSEASASAS